MLENVITSTGSLIHWAVRVCSNLPGTRILPSGTCRRLGLNRAVLSGLEGAESSHGWLNLNLNLEYEICKTDAKYYKVRSKINETELK